MASFAEPRGKKNFVPSEVEGDEFRRAEPRGTAAFLEWLQRLSWFSRLRADESVYESTPNSGGYYHITQTYWANGAPDVLSNLTGVPTITYGVDGEGRISSASASSGQNPLSSTTYNPAGEPLKVTFGSADSDTFTYYPNSDRMNTYTYKIGSLSAVGTLTWNTIGTLASLAITDPFNTSDAQTCTYAHDDLSRIASDSCTGSSDGAKPSATIHSATSARAVHNRFSLTIPRQQTR